MKYFLHTQPNFTYFVQENPKSRSRSMTLGSISEAELDLMELQDNSLVVEYGKKGKVPSWDEVKEGLLKSVCLDLEKNPLMKSSPNLQKASSLRRTAISGILSKINTSSLSSSSEPLPTDLLHQKNNPLRKGLLQLNNIFKKMIKEAGGYGEAKEEDVEALGPLAFAIFKIAQGI